MSYTLAGIITLVTLFVLLSLGMAVGFAMLLAGALGIFLISGPQAAIGLLQYQTYSNAASFTLSVIPLFILMGYFAFSSGVTKQLFDAAAKWLSKIPGGLALATIATCTGFSAACGSSVATAASVGRVTISEMRRHGYTPSISCGIVAAGGTLGILIPPSITMVLYGILTGASIGKLLLAGFLPGLLVAAGYSVTVLVMARWKPALVTVEPEVRKSYTWGERFAALKGGLGILIIAVVVMGSIYTGIATPTEAAAVGAFGAFLLFLALKRFDFKSLKEAVLETAHSTTTIMIIIVGALTFVAGLGLSQLPARITEFIVAQKIPTVGLLFALFTLYLFLGTFLDPLGMMVLTLPFVLPALQANGVDLVWFGILMVRFIEIGLITPPFGMNVFVIQSVVPDVKTDVIFKGITPFLVSDIITTSALIMFPQIVMLVPNAMSR